MKTTVMTKFHYLFNKSETHTDAVNNDFFTLWNSIIKDNPHYAD